MTSCGVSSLLFDLPVTHATCVSLFGWLLVVGEKKESSDDPTTIIHILNPSTDSWETVSKMNCFAAVLPDNRLMVVGNYTADQFFDAKTVEIAQTVVE